MMLRKKNEKQETKSQRRLREAALMQEERKHILTSGSDFFIREAYKTLRTNVSFALANVEDSKVVLVTSSQQSEGKSITAINLAISYAQMERKVLVIDCDLRRPKVARLLRIATPEGLSNLLMSRTKTAESLIVRSDIKNLDVLPAGDIPPNPSELLASPKMEQVLAELKEKYDLIVLDTPPVNMVTDAVALAPQTDGVLFVVRANITERGAVIHAVEQLEYTKIKILGFILNGVDLEHTSYGYSKQHYKRYGYRRYSFRRYGYAKYGYTKYGYGYSSRRHSQEQKDTAQ